MAYRSGRRYGRSRRSRRRSGGRSKVKRTYTMPRGGYRL